MPAPHTSHELQLADSPPNGGGCGCGGCGCGSAATKGNEMTTTSYDVTGMTCGHCASAVTSELKSLDGVSDVSVDLVAGGTSSVTVTSAQPLDRAQVAAALDEAGDYHLA